MKHIAIVGASVGGLVAAAELSQQGFDVTIFETGKSVAGMYGRVDTPFGRQELGMHVLYLADQHFDHLCSIFGEDAFHSWRGPSVDVAANRNFGCNFFGSAYPDVRDQSLLNSIREQVLATCEEDYHPANALEAVTGRFGDEAGRNVYAPILKKLWKSDADLLSKDAIHCFYDLRRIVLCDKEEADRIKNDPWLDSVIANPIQSQPCSEVFGGRLAASFKNLSSSDLEGRVHDWLRCSGVHLEFGRPAEIYDGKLMVDGNPIDASFQACIVATPVAALMPDIAAGMDRLELSIFYFRLNKSLGNNCPAYYILLHESRFLSSRMVNYDAYSVEDTSMRSPVIAVEVVHHIGKQPAAEIIASEVKTVFPMAEIAECHVFPRSLKMAIPSIRNGHLIDTAIGNLNTQFEAGALYFTGMRTDKGIFFSHHTIGSSHNAALDCAQRLS